MGTFVVFDCKWHQSTWIGRCGMNQNIQNRIEQNKKGTSMFNTLTCNVRSPPLPMVIWSWGVEVAQLLLSQVDCDRCWLYSVYKEFSASKFLIKWDQSLFLYMYCFVMMTRIRHRVAICENVSISLWISRVGSRRVWRHLMVGACMALLCPSNDDGQKHFPTLLVQQ